MADFCEYRDEPTVFHESRGFLDWSNNRQQSKERSIIMQIVVEVPALSQWPRLSTIKFNFTVE
jgi:hypothetical protein